MARIGHLSRRSMLRGVSQAALFFQPFMRTLRAQTDADVRPNVFFMAAPCIGMSFRGRLFNIPGLNKTRWGFGGCGRDNYNNVLNYNNIMTYDALFASSNDKDFEAEFLYARPRANADGSFDLPYALNPLESLKGDILLLGGIQGLPTPHTNPDELKAGDPFKIYSHDTGLMTFLCPATIQERPRGGGRNCSGGIGYNTPTIASFDNFLADRFGVPLLHLGFQHSTDVFPCSSNNAMSFTKNAQGVVQPVFPQGNPKQTFLNLFGTILDCGNAGGGSTQAQLSAAEYKLMNQSLLDYLRTDIDAVKRQTAPAEFAAVDDYLTALRELEKNLFQSQSILVSDQCPPSKDKCDVYTDYAENINDINPAIMGQMMDIAALSMACGLRPVVSLICEDGVHGGRTHQVTAGTTMETHAITHSESIDQFLDIHRFYTQSFADLATRMKALTFNGQSALDRSLLVWGGQLGNTSDHRMTDIPYVLAGGLGGKFRTGEFIDYGRASGTLRGRVLTTIQHALGYGDAVYGDNNFSGAYLPQLLKT